MKFIRKNEESKACTCAKSECSQKNSGAVSESNVKILGSGCTKCNQLEAATKEALTQLEMDDDIEHVKDFLKISTYGVISTPALVVDNKVVSYGKVLTTGEIVQLIRQARS